MMDSHLKKAAVFQQSLTKPEENCLLLCPDLDGLFADQLDSMTEFARLVSVPKMILHFGRETGKFVRDASATRKLRAGCILASQCRISETGICPLSGE
jgi:hypothetical protein